MAPRRRTGPCTSTSWSSGAGLSGIGAGHYLQTQCPWADLRHLRSPRRHRWHVGSVPVSGHPLRLGHAHAGLLVPALGRARSPSPTATPSSSTSRTPRRVRRRRPHPLQPPDHRGRLVDARLASGTSPRSGPTPARPSRSPLVPLLLHRLLPLRPRLPARLRGHGRLRRHPRAPAGLARGPRRRRASGSWSSAAAPRPSPSSPRWHGRPRTSTMLQRSPTYVASLPGEEPGRGAAAQGPARPDRPGPPPSGSTPSPTQAFYAIEPALPEAGPADAAPRASSASFPPGYDIATHFTPRYDPWDQRFCAVPERRSLQVAIRDGAASVVTDRIERFTEQGLLLASGDELEADIIVTATGLELLFLGGIALKVDGETVDPAVAAHLQGHDARGRARTWPSPSGTPTRRGR